MEFNIQSEQELKGVAEEIYNALIMKMALEERTGKQYGAITIGLFGNLGSGKTTFTKYFAEKLGIKPSQIISPTFVLQKRFDISNVTEEAEKNKNPQNIKHPFKNFYHLDVYRIESSKEIETLWWRENVANPQNIILVEWADKIQDILPNDTLKMFFESTGENSRKIKVEIN